MEKKILSTLCYIEKAGSWLMLYRNKKKNDPCEGKWVGVGGKFEPGETADECLLREVREETGFELTEYHFCGIVHFVSDTWPDEDMHLYTAQGFQGEDTFPAYSPGQSGENGAEKVSAFVCDEGDLMWISKEQVLNLNLWDGDRYFLKPLIAGETDIHMTCRYEGHTCVSVEKES